MSASFERRRFDAFVVGAGIVGSALALGLKRRGLDVAVVESTPAAAWRAESPDLRVYAIAPDSEALLAALGVWPAVRAARAQPYAAMQVWDAGGGAPLRFDAAALGVPRLGHIVEHGLLVDRLQAALAAADVPRLDAAVEGIDAGEDDVTLRLSGERRVRALAEAAVAGSEQLFRERAVEGAAGEADRERAQTRAQRVEGGGGAEAKALGRAQVRAEHGVFRHEQPVGGGLGEQHQGGHWQRFQVTPGARGE